MGTDLNSVVKQEGSRRENKQKSKKDKPSTSKVIAEARWLDKSERQDDHLTKEGKVVATSVLCQAARAGQEVRGANANKSRLPLQGSMARSVSL